MVKISESRGFAQARSLSFSFEGTAADLDAALSPDTIPHNLGAIPTTVVAQFQLGNGRWSVISDINLYIEATDTALHSAANTFASISGAGTNIRLTAATGSPSIAVPFATGISAGLLSSQAQDIGGFKTFTDGLAGSLTGDVSGNAGTVTNGVYTIGAQTIAGVKTFNSTIVGDIDGNAATATLATSVINGAYVNLANTFTAQQFFTDGLELKSGGVASTDNFRLVANASSNVVAFISETGTASEGQISLGNASTSATSGTPAVRIRGSGDSFLTGGSFGVGTSSPAVIGDFRAATSSLSRVQVKNTASGSAGFIADAATNGDAFMYFSENGTVEWVMGHDSSNSSAFVIGTGSVVGASNAIRITTSGALVVTDTIVGNGGLDVVGVYNSTTANAANVHVDSGGVFRRSTSALKYKREVEDLDYGLETVMKQRPVRYKSKCEDDCLDDWFIGFISDWEEEHVPELISYGKDGVIEGFEYSKQTAVNTKAIQELKAEKDALEARVAALESGA